MSYEEILQQLKDYVFSDEDPKHCAERYMEVMKIPFRLQIIPLAEQAIYALNEEFQKVDTPKGRANVKIRALSWIPMSSWTGTRSRLPSTIII